MTKRQHLLCDADIRPALLAQLSKKHSHEPSTVFVEELGFCRGQARIDVAMVNGHLHGYEIKSDRDSLRRLSGQIDIYNAVLDRATLVVGERHLPQALEIIPSWWSVVLTQAGSTGPRFRPLRRGRKNPGRDSRSLVELLWLDDAIAMLEERNVARGVRGKPRRMVWDRVCEHFSLDEIAETVREHLKTRATSRVTPLRL